MATRVWAYQDAGRDGPPPLRAALVAALTLAGCAAAPTSAGPSIDASADATHPPQCVPGLSVACVCGAGLAGAQTCTPAGAFAPCQCGALDGTPAEANLQPDAPWIADGAPADANSNLAMVPDEWESSAEAASTFDATLEDAGLDSAPDSRGPVWDGAL